VKENLPGLFESYTREGCPERPLQCFSQHGSFPPANPGADRVGVATAYECELITEPVRTVDTLECRHSNGKPSLLHQNRFAVTAVQEHTVINRDLFEAVPRYLPDDKDAAREHAGERDNHTFVHARLHGENYAGKQAE
jgi:hypothetical protein